MATYLISILAALAVVMIITVLGLVLAKMIINRAEKIQTQRAEQLQGVFIDLDNLPNNEQQSGIVVISNDAMEDTRARRSAKKTVSFTDQENSTVQQIHAHKSLTLPTVISSENPITNRITLDY